MLLADFLNVHLVEEESFDEPKIFVVLVILEFNILLHFDRGSLLTIANPFLLLFATAFPCLSNELRQVYYFLFLLIPFFSTIQQYWLQYHVLFLSTR